jgi:Protein of unknown function (DUF3313)
MRSKTYSIAIATALLLSSSAMAQAIRKLAPGQEFSGFLREYSQLKPRTDIPGGMLTYVNQGRMKGLRQYIAILVDPVQVYIETVVDESSIPEKDFEAAAAYFRQSLARSVSDAFPVVEEPGPLTLRLRSAIVGVDVGGKVDTSAIPEGVATPFEHAITIGKVSVELELIDSQTGERIAAAVDKAPLGEGAEVGADNFSRVERYQAAKEAFDGWAERVREFLDAEHDLNQEGAQRAQQSYRPY